MRKGSRVLSILVVLFSLLVITTTTFAAEPYSGGQHTQPLITQPIDETHLVTLGGNTRSEANANNDRGPVADNLPMEHIQLVLQRPAGLEKQLETLIAEQQHNGSSYYHKWLTPKQFGEKYGVSPQDVIKLTTWLESHGFRVDSVFNSGMAMEFSGTAAQIKEAFHTEIHNLEVDGQPHIANMSDPKIPAALAGVLKGVYSLHDFMPHSMMKKRTNLNIVLDGTLYYALAPPDLATIYNLNPAFAAGYTGAGQTIVVIEDTNILNASDVATFRSAFGLSGYTGTFTQINPTGAATCTNPGVNGAEDEAALDAEWSGASAPNANIVLASCRSLLAAVQNVVNGATPPNVMSISYGECESENGASSNLSYNNAYQQGASEGVSIFVSSGDESAASCDANRAAATHGIAVSGFTSTPYNVSVGGTDFGDTYEAAVGGPPVSTYWSATNSATFGTALSYMPEIPWNDSCASYLLYSLEGFSQAYGASGFCNDTTIPGTNFRSTASGSGGPSNCATGAPAAGQTGVTGGTCAGYPKPSWQSGLVGNPSDGVRDIPDVSLFAANGLWNHFYVFCMTDTAEGGAPACDYTNATDVNDLAAGGTSFSSPIMAGIQALINQASGEGFQGNPNPRYYALAGLEYGATGDSACNSSLGTGANSSCVFYDVTLGDMDVNCDEDVSRGAVVGTFNCFGSAANGATVTEQGALSVSNSALQIAYGTSTGWDFSTGIGTVNAYNLIQNWTSVVTTTAVTSSQNPSTYGQSVTFTATITPAIGSTETGSVQFVIDGVNSGSPVSVSSGTASLSISTLTAGNHTVTATYSGDSNYSGSSATLSGGQTVNQATNTVTFTTPAPASAEYGSSFTVAASGLGTGAITYTSDGVVCTNSGATYLMISGSGTCTVTATQAADTNYQAASSSEYVAAQPAVGSVGVSLTSGSNPSTYGDSITFTATVTSDTGAVKGRRTTKRPRDLNGSVAWSANTGCASSGVSGNSGQTATCTTSILGGGSDTVTATYTANDSNHTTASGSINQTVNPASQTITVTTSAPSTAIDNSSFTIVASASSGLPVSFASSGTCTNSAGTYTITAGARPGTLCHETVSQAGNSNYSAATAVSETTTVVGPTPPTVSFTGPSPATAPYGSSFTVTASSVNDASVPVITTSTGSICQITGSSTSGTTVTSTVQMLSGSNVCDLAANWAVNTVYKAAVKNLDIRATKVTTTPSFTGAPATANNGGTFTVTASSNSSATPSITTTTPAECSIVSFSSNGPGSYQATVTVLKATGTCKLKAVWPTNADYTEASANQSTTAQ